MGNARFQRFVAVFTGILLAVAAVLAVTTGDEGLIGTALLVGALYAVYMVQFTKKEKARRAKQPQESKSPLLRR